MMTEQMKEEIVSDALRCRRWELDNSDSKTVAPYIIKLVRALDNYQKRDSKGRFCKNNS